MYVGLHVNHNTQKLLSRIYLLTYNYHTNNNIICFWVLFWCIYTLVSANIEEETQKIKLK